MVNLVALKEVVIIGIDSLLLDEANRLRTAVENGELISNSDEARLLVSAGLLEQVRDDSSIRIEEIVYRPTSKGMDVYKSIYGI